MTYAERAEKMVADLRIHTDNEGPAFGQVKAQAANVYALLAVATELAALTEAVRDAGGVS